MKTRYEGHNRHLHKPVHNLIATRAFNLQGQKRDVVVTMGTPELDPKSPHGDWRCPFRISGLRSSRLRYGYGVDAFQSLLSALAGIRNTLEPYRTELSWIGGQLDSAFPRFVPGGFPGRLAERIEKFIDDQVLALTNCLQKRIQRHAAQLQSRVGHGRRLYNAQSLGHTVDKPQPARGSRKGRSNS